MFEILTKRTDEMGTYYEIIPIGEYSDKWQLCGHYDDDDVLILETANNLYNL